MEENMGIIAFVNRRGIVAVVPVILIILNGCQARQLENHALRQASTLSDLQYRQVMNNLAAMASNSSALPYFSAAQAGHTTIVVNPSVNNVVSWDLITAAGALFNKTLFDKGSVTAAYSQQNNETWDTSSSLDPLQLYMMQGLYRRALGLPVPEAQQLVLDTFFSPVEPKKATYGPAAHPKYSGVYAAAMQSLYHNINPSSFGVGKKCDVPRNACYVGHHSGCYVWVLPGHMEDLTNLTIAIIDVGTIDTGTLTGAPRKQSPPAAGQNVFPSIQ
jgi:hypothetical protein